MNHDDFLPPEHDENSSYDWASYYLRDDSRLRELAAEIPRGPWTYKRGNDGALVIWADNEPLFTVLAGIDLAKYICEVSPARLLPGYR